MKKSQLKRIVTPSNKRIIVDAYMKPVLLHLWDKGVQTRFSCAGHIPDFKAYIDIERNDDFEEYAMKSPWEHHIRPIITINDYLQYIRVLKQGEDARLSDYIKNTGRTSFIVYARHDKEGSSQKDRCRFLRWLLEY